MSSAGIASNPDVAMALSLIARVLVRLAGESSPQAVHCENQTRAARDALLTVACAPDSRPVSSANGSAADGQRQVRSMDDAGALLADAESVVSQLPEQVRNEIAVCAAMSYLRRARRALVIP